LRFILGLLILSLPQVGWKGEERLPLSSAVAAAVVDSVGREYYHAKSTFYPAYATYKGLEDYNGSVSAFAPNQRAGFLRRIKRMQRDLASFDEDSLAMGDWIDFKALMADMATQTFMLEDLEIWRSSPICYADACIHGIYSLLVRADDPDAGRNLAARLAQIPEITRQARLNLSRPMRLHCEVAAVALRDFLPMLTGLQGDTAGHLDIDKALLDEAYSNIEDFAGYIDSLALRADPGFSLGYENFAKLLETRYMIHDTPEELLGYAETVLADAQAEQAEFEPAPSNSPQATPEVADLTDQEILAYWQAEADSALEFIRREDLATVPGGTEIKVIETPRFLKSLIAGYAYEPPGPFDPRQIGLLYVPLAPEPDHRDQMHRQLGLGQRQLRAVVVHEVWPGHHLQLVTANRHPSFIRRMQDDIFAIEGWAFYCEEMMARKGFYGDQEMTRPLGGVIFRAARVIVDIRLQLGDFTLEDATDFMVNETGASRDFVEMEVRRYAVTPGQAMSYLIGRREVLRLRDDFKGIMGESFTLKAFHDGLLSCGSLPLYLLRTCAMSEAM
jgi:uncharacterized protein (DUF885 family)